MMGIINRNVTSQTNRLKYQLPKSKGVYHIRCQFRITWLFHYFKHYQNPILLSYPLKSSYIKNSNIDLFIFKKVFTLKIHFEKRYKLN